MMMCAPEDEQEFVTRTIDRGEITPNRSKPNHYSVSYDDTLLLHFFIMKKDGCYKQEDFRMSGDELHYIRSWLESPKKPTELVVPENEDEMTTYYYGVFTSVQPYVVDGDCYGLRLEFTCDSPYGYSSERMLEYEPGEALQIEGSFTNISSEESELLSPTITITSTSTFGSDEEISFTNTSDDNKVMSVHIPSGLSKLIINCEKRIIVDDQNNLVTMSDIGLTTPINGEYDSISTDIFSFNWFAFINGSNDFVIDLSEGNTVDTIEIKTRFKIKSGGF